MFIVYLNSFIMYWYHVLEFFCYFHVSKDIPASIPSDFVDCCLTGDLVGDYRDVLKIVYKKS